jgi:hypothetical protein
MISKRSLALSALVLIFAVLAIAMTPQAAEAADPPASGDWVIAGGLETFTDRSLEARGNVTIQGGATLKLVNSTLAINGTENGMFRLQVLAGGKLEAYDSLIYGSNARVSFFFHDDTTLERSEIRHFYGAATGPRGMIADGGSVLVRDSVIQDSNYHGIYIQTDTTLDNVTFRSISQSSAYVYNWGASAPYVVDIRNCDFTGTGSTGWWVSGIMTYVFTSGEDVDVTVQDCTFTSIARGFYGYGTGSSDVTVERCTFIDCGIGLSMSSQTTGGTYVFRDNTITAPAKAHSIGIESSMRSGMSVTIERNNVHHVGTGYRFEGPWSGSHSNSIGDLEVNNCSVGIESDYNLHLTVHNSSVVDISDSYGSFVSRNASTITVIDTESAWGSATVHSSGWVRAYTDIRVIGARWKGGDRIYSGDLVLENVTQFEVARFNLSNLKSKDIVGWEVDSGGARTSRYLYPAMYMDGHGFRGDRFDIKEYTPGIFDLMDDSKPVVGISIPPEDGVGYNVSTIVAEGEYSELGSGMGKIEYSLDGGLFTAMTSYHGGSWTLPLVDLPEGDHTLTMRPTDKVGNVGSDTKVSFVIDTILPLIDLAATEELVNVTTIEVFGATEPLATVLVAGREVTVQEDGTFSSVVDLREGPNTISVVVVDRASNLNMTSFDVERDTIFPELVLTAPEGGVWTNVRFVYVEGLTEDGTDVRVAGIPVPVVNGTFKRRVDLEQGEYVINVSSSDRAGNMARASVTLFVDWMPPGLVIVEPEEAEVYVRESTFYISGDVDDPTIDHVLINGQHQEMTSGRFVKQYTLLEGRTVYIVNVTDAAGNFASAQVIVHRDLTAPSTDVLLNSVGGELVHKEGDLYSTSLAIEVVVTMDEEAVVRLDDGTKLPLGTKVTLQFDLTEGVNELAFTVTDRAGNQATAYRQRVLVDTTAPPITIFEPAPGARTMEDTAIIHGTTEVGSQLSIDDQSVQLLPGGEFRFVVALEDGRNDFTIEVVDAMGNTNSTAVSVLRESEVKEEQVSTTGPMIGGFAVGVIVGIVLALAFTLVMGRRERDEAQEMSPRDKGAPAPAKEEAPTAEEADDHGGWEEF